MAVFGGHTVEQLLTNFSECLRKNPVFVASRSRPIGQIEYTSNFNQTLRPAFDR